MRQKASGKRQCSSRVRQKREQARHQILQAARNILREGGVEAVTLASVTAVLGMTKQALYHYFPSKEALIRSLVTSFIDDEVETLLAAIEAANSDGKTLGTLIRAFYNHYINSLEVFRTVYCQSQMYSGTNLKMDKETIRDEINPRMQYLFDTLEARLTHRSLNKRQRERMRHLAFTAWTSALGLITMLSVADALKDPILHTDKDLVDTLASVFDEASIHSNT